MNIIDNNKNSNDSLSYYTNFNIYDSLSPKRKNKITLINIYEFLVNNNYNIKKFSYSSFNQELYFVNTIDNSAVIKIQYKIQFHLTIPLKNCNYEYSTIFNNIDKLFDYLKYHINYLNDKYI